MTDYYDSGREREFYTYYDAYRALSDSDPPFADLYDAEAAARHEPKLATDPTLTAFCQLGALRMNTKRCMIFFFDQTNGYVLAESTQSHHSGHAGELWLGASIIPRGLSVCEHTINIEDANYGSNKDSPNAGQVHIINDFLQDQRFCNRPYVKEGPRARFYCGVPIKTPSGANIGAYCALGEEPRDGVSDEDVDFMKHMGSLVMGHLSSLRRSAEYERGARMLQGLGVITRHDDESNSPIEGMAERIGDEASPSSSTSSSRRMPKYVGTYTPMLSEYASDYAAETDDQSEKRRNPRKQRAAVSTNLKSEVFVNQAQQATEAEKEHANGPPPLGRAPKSSDSSQSTSTCHTDGNEPSNSLERQIKAKFQEASQLLLDAVKSDGVVFLDATFAKPPGDPTASRHFTGLGLSDRSTDESDGSRTGHAPNKKNPLDSGAKCEILGHSEARGVGAVPSFDNMITERFLKSLMQRYSKGKTWTFDADGQESSERFLKDLAATVPQSDNATSATISRTLRETPKLQRLFNLGLRTLCFTPMWDPVRERWYAAALTWSKSPRHGFSGTNELSYLNAFCDVTMAEVLRIESKQEAKSRTALMSSVSHELRTPIHGILGSIDLLRGAASLDLSLIEQVQQCSLNLVDVIDHLLDFAQISKAISRHSSSHRPGQGDDSVATGSKHVSCISLARTTEAIVDAVFYSHYFSHRDRTRPHVDLVTDLAVQPNIRCMIPVGAWKRLCTNIVNNALKYTHEGYVKVSLAVVEHATKTPYATLTVADSGVGMSDGFLKGSLFKAFAQEDPLAVGTGLGMSLVAQLVKEFRGRIEVTSKKGEGTTMVVTIPIETETLATESEFGHEFSHSGYCIAFVDSQSANDATNRRMELTNAAKRTFQHLGVRVVPSDGATTVAILEADFVHLQSTSPDNERRWLILCDTFASATQLRARFKNSVLAEFVPQPYGPDRLSAAIRKLCTLDSQQSVLAEPGAHGSRVVNGQLESLGAMSESAVPALPSPPLELSLEHLSLNSSDSTTVRSSVQPPSAGIYPQLVAAQEEDLVPASTDKNTASESTTATDPLTLLLVDDNPINLKLLTMVADRSGFPRLLATNGKEAVDAYVSFDRQLKQDNQSTGRIPTRRPDVILLDLNMPIMDGYEAAQQIRQFEKREGIPRSVIVAITGLGDDIARAKAYQHGFNHFMSKPVRPQQLTDMLGSIIETKKRSREAEAVA